MTTRRCLIAGLLASGLAWNAPAFAHGGTYRGPGDTNPPGGGGGGSGPGPANPGPGAPTGGPPAIGPVSGPTSPGGPAGGPASAPSGGPVSTTGDGVDLTIWDFWWGFNKDPFLKLRNSVHAVGVLSGTDEWFLGQGQKENAMRSLAPSPLRVRGEVVPALEKVLSQERANDILSAAMIALAKIGDIQDESGESRFEGLLTRFLADSNQEVAETAAVALGILANDSSVATLSHLARDSKEGRVLVGRKAEVPYRTRAYACFGLGLIGARSADDLVRRECVAQFTELLQAPSFSTRDLKVAAMTALGLVPLPFESDEEASAREALSLRFPGEDQGLELSDVSKRAASSRQAQLTFLLEYFDPDQRRRHKLTRHEYVIAHAPRAIVRLLPPEADLPARIEEIRELKGLVWEQLSPSLRPQANERREVVQGVILALGQLADSDRDDTDSAIRATLERLVTEGRYQQDRYFATIALAQAGSRRGLGAEPYAGLSSARNKLLERIARGRGQTRPWAALALGILGRQLIDAGEVLEDSTSRALREATKACRRPAEIGAYTLALGLRRDQEALSLLQSKLQQMSPDRARGHIAVSLGLLGERSAQDDISSIVRDSQYRPELIKQAAIGLGLLGDKQAVDELILMLRDAQSTASQAAVASALGTIGDDRSLDPLLAMLKDQDLTDSARGFAAVALGIACDKEPLPWNSKLSTDINYRASTTTLTSTVGTGVLDIL